MRLALLWATHGRDNQKSAINLWVKCQAFCYYQQTFSIFLALLEDIAGHLNHSEPHMDISKIYSQTIVTLAQTCIFQILLISSKEWSLVSSFLWYLFYLLYKGVISACLRNSRNVDDFMELLKLLQRILLKILLFSFKNFNCNIRVYWCFPYLQLALKSLFWFSSDQPQ